MTKAVKLCGAAAGVASTVRTVAIPACWLFAHSGLKDVLKPDSGKPTRLKQTCPAVFSGLVIVTLTLTSSPTFTTTDEGVTVMPKATSNGSFGLAAAVTIGCGRVVPVCAAARRKIKRVRDIAGSLR